MESEHLVGWIGVRIIAILNENSVLAVALTGLSSGIPMGCLAQWSLPSGGTVIDLNDLLQKVGLDPETVMVMRHRPTEKALRVALPTLAAERHDVYNAYQSEHADRTEGALSKASYLASFIGHEAGRAIFVGLYRVAGFKRITVAQYHRIPGNDELLALGTRGPAPGRKPLWFDLRLCAELSDFKGRLVVEWPGIERSWWRWADRNCFRVQCIHPESQLIRPMPPWTDLSFSWTELRLLPESWRRTLSQWRGVYFIFDVKLKKGYVGSASGDENLLGRWSGYAMNGHGGNRLLKERDPRDFVFTILERVSPDMPSADVVAIENTWKRRLHTAAPYGLNDN